MVEPLVHDERSLVMSDDAKELPVRSLFTVHEKLSTGQPRQLHDTAESLAKALTGQSKIDELHASIIDSTEDLADTLMMGGLSPCQFTADEICRELSSGRLKYEDIVRAFTKVVVRGVAKWQKDRK